MPDSPPADTRTTGGDKTQAATIDAVTCLACGCLCDDLVVAFDGSGRLASVRKACPIGEAWFLENASRADEEGWATALIDGEPADPVEAVARAGALLAGSRSPVVLGLDRSTNETVAAAVGLADRIGAYVEVGDGASSTPRILAFQRAGRVSATLGEVRARADVVVLWRADPVATHPRHLERYSAEPRGRFVPEGRAGRTVIVVDTGRTATAGRADATLAIDEDREFEVLWTLRALVRDAGLGDDRIRAATGCEPESLRALAARLRAARYGAFFLGEVAGPSPARAAARIEAANLLVRDLREHTRFVLLGMGTPGNRTGAESVLARQTGFPTCVDLGAGHPESLPGVATASADVALIVGEGAPPRYPGAETTRIVIGRPALGATPDRAAVWLTSSLPGLDEAGTVTRVDGISLPLRAHRPSRFPGEREWITRIHDAIGHGARA
ncbi:Formyltransferase/hydrolase complex Fhc subunit B [Aquisphaera giovannonii]|uniref:Formyltransferase/hydrolase complex Fhc subunit B n=1 Tax=Aquisphaera giovannonii TaxID=406548 RepID=A0A5B9WAQ1_9BACT|nr:formylmethanofuran dehydrogenase subunit B [Aquisphaera giovannonii]QEH37334.1 Formyltransferase/hydrolase complex Fhc subunit B [Aquisphaera giovannonii]